MVILKVVLRTPNILKKLEKYHACFLRIERLLLKNWPNLAVHFDKSIPENDRLEPE